MKKSLLLSAFLLVAAVFPATAAIFTYSTLSGTPTETWSLGTGWSGVPTSGIDTTLTFESPNTALFSTGAAIISNNDLVPPFALNVLNLQGTQPASGAASLTVSGGTLQFEKDTLLANPTVNLNALGANLTYTVTSNLQLNANTTFTGAGTAVFKLGNAGSGATLSGAGNLTKSGTSTLILNGAQSGKVSEGVYAGNISVTAGALKLTSNVATTGTLNVAGGTFMATGGTTNIGVSGLFGSGTIGNSTGTSYISVNYNGATTDAFAGNGGNSTYIVKNGSGTLSMQQVNHGGGGIVYWGQLNTVVPSSTNTHVTANGGTLNVTTAGTMTFSAGPAVNSGATMIFAPSGSGAAATWTVSLDSASEYLFLNSGRLILNRGGYTNFDTVARNVGGGAIISSATGLSELGSAVKLRVQNGTLPTYPVVLPTLYNGGTMVAPSFIGQQAESLDANLSGSFLTYDGTGLATDNGFKLATTTNTNFSGTPVAADIVDVNTATALSTDTAVFALKTSANITIAAGKTLTLGASGVNSGLIFNGGSISGGSFTTGNRSVNVYVSKANGELSSALTGYSNAPFYITGPGVLKSSSLAGSGLPIFVQGGATLDLNGTALNTGSYVSLSAGVLQSNGTFAKTVGAAAANKLVFSSIGGGGFAARGGALTVQLNRAAEVFNASPLKWGSEASGVFLADGSPLLLGSATADSLMDFQNNIDLGGSGVNTTLMYSRIINVADNPNSTADVAKISGIISSTITEAAGIVKDGAGKLILSGANTYRGSTTVSKGTLSISSDGNLGTAPTAVNPTARYNGQGVLTINGGTLEATETFTLNANRGIAVGSGVGTINVADTKTLTYNGEITRVMDEIGALTKSGNGKLVLAGTNTYTGVTTVSTGTLIINGNQSAATGATTVNSGATLGGSGTIGGAVNISAGGTLSPGNSPGLLTIAGPLTLAGNVAMEIIGTTRGVVGGYDAVDIGNGQLLTYGGTLTLTMAAAVADGTYDLFSSVTLLTPLTKTSSFSSIVFNGGGFYSGTFSQVGDLWTSTLTNGQIFTFDQASGDLVSAVPEPSTWVLLAIGLTVLLTLRRRRSA